MFEKFVLWLATRFLGELAVIQLFTKKVFEPNGSAAFQAVVESIGPDNLKDSFNAYAVQHLTARFDHAEIGFILALLTIKKQLILAGNTVFFDEFVTKLQDIRLGTNALKVNKELQDLVRYYTLIIDEPVIKSIASSLQHSPSVPPQLLSTFIKQV